MAEHRRAWDQRVNEPDRAYRAFRAWLEEGRKRSIARTAAELEMSEATLYRYSSEWDWRLRAAAHDDHMSMLYASAGEQEYVEMARRHQAVAQAGMQAVLTELAHYSQLQAERATIYTQLPANPMDDDQQQARLRRTYRARLMSARDMAQLLGIVADLEHRIVVTEGAQATRLDEELSKMSPTELRGQLAALLQVEPEHLERLGL